jgi:hypothetical protein
MIISRLKIVIERNKQVSKEMTEGEPGESRPMFVFWVLGTNSLASIS